MSGRPTANNSQEGAQAAPSGFLLIDKQEGPTSFDIISQLRRVTGERRIGHAGTLDPLATGLLIVAVGREATRELRHFVGMPKRYDAEIRLGATSATDDREGPITPVSKKQPKQGEVETVLQKFLGVQQQLPPRFSAIKLEGKKAYAVARAGGSLDLQPRQVQITSLGVVEYSFPVLRLRVECSSGTYIRALARDIGETLGTGAYLESLRRIGIGEYSVENSQPIASLVSSTDWTQYLFKK